MVANLSMVCKQIVARNDIPLHCWQAGLLSSHFTLRVLQLEHPRLDFVCALRLRRALGTAVEVFGEIVMRDRDRNWLRYEVEDRGTCLCSRIPKGTSFVIEVEGHQRAAQ
jgi:hypothetical protein